MRRVELLAPAGNYESFLGAINAGADAVYLGGDKFGARAYAENFNTQELCRAVRYAHLFGKKVYLTLNTLIKEREFAQVYEYVLPFYEAGIDGIIVQDMGVFAFVREHFPGLPLHVSTQMTVTGVNGAAFLKDQGAERIVPARELSLEEIKVIKDKTGLSIETFIHGAMCYCYSGQCLFSSILGGRSGNRGKCAQPCRLPYQVLDRDKRAGGSVNYPLSLKDMCTIDNLPDLIEAGIDSFKIEGRMKKPEYAAGVTAIYRKYIDLYYEKGRENYIVSPADKQMLESLYIRSEIENGYYYRHNGGEMITKDFPGYSGSDDAVLQKVRSRYLEQKRKLPVVMSAVFCKGNEAVLTVSCQNARVTVSGKEVQQAVKQPVTRENIADGLTALGESEFTLEELDIVAEDDIFYPLKGIKELRREALARLSEELCGDFSERHAVPVHQGKSPGKNIYKHSSADTIDGALRVLVTKKEQMEAVLESGLAIHRLYVDSDLLCEGILILEDYKNRLLRTNPHVQIYPVLPYIIRNHDRAYLDRLLPVLQASDGCMVRNAEGYAWLRSAGYRKPICGDAGLYIWNRESHSFWEDKLDGFCLPYELSEKGQADLPLDERFEKVIYGHLPMMLTANCVAKTSGRCMLGAKNADHFSFAIKDRYAKNFPVYTNCVHCYNVIYNSVPLSLHGKLGRNWPEMRVSKRLDFTVEDYRQTKEVLKYFGQMCMHTEDDAQARLAEAPFEEYTTGHEKRGAE